MNAINQLKVVAADHGFTLRYDRKIKLWTLSDNSGQKSAYYFTKYLLTNVTVDEFKRYHFN